MTTPEPQPDTAAPPPFQFSLRTLLLLFVVLGSSLAVFGAWGIVVFVAGGGAGDLRSSKSNPCRRWAYFALVVLCLMAFWPVLLLPAVDAVREAARRASCRNNLKQIALALQNYHSSERLFPAGIHRRQERQADAQLAGAHTALHGVRCSLQGLRLQPNLGTGRRTRSCWLHRLIELCLPERRRRRLRRREPDKLCRRRGTECRLGGREAEEARAISGKDPSHTIMLVEVANSGIAWTEPRDFSLDTLECGRWQVAAR